MLTRPYNDDMKRKLHHVKTMKILQYSNVIATSSNVITQAMKIYSGDLKVVKDIDFAGVIGTIIMIITDFETQRKIKEEFVFGSYNQMIKERKYNLKCKYE